MVGNTRGEKGLKLNFQLMNEGIITKPCHLLICKFLYCEEVP